MTKKNAKKTPLRNAPPRIRGRGDYSVSQATNDLDSRLRKLETTAPTDKARAYRDIGEDLGSRFGFGGMGKKVGGILSVLSGHGDYHVGTNSLMPGKGSLASNAVPVFSKDGRRGVRITEREYIGDVRSGPNLVSGATTFHNQSFRVNPGLNRTFPWLAAIATQYDQWEPLGLVFEYVSTSSDYNGTGQALGTVIMASDYDTADPAFTSKLQMENEDYANSTKASMTAMHGIECDPKERSEKLMFVRNGPCPTGTVVADYDLCNFQIATQGMNAANVTLGELWVSYDFVFYKKNLVAGQLGGSVLSCSYYNAGSNAVTSGQPFGYYAASQQYGSMYIRGGGTNLYFPSYITNGTYFVSFTWLGTGTVAAQPGLTFENCANASAWPPNSSLIDYSSGNNSFQLIVCFAVTVTAANAVIGFGGIAMPNAVAYVRGMVTQVNPGVFNTPLTEDSA